MKLNSSKFCYETQLYDKLNSCQPVHEEMNCWQILNKQYYFVKLLLKNKAVITKDCCSVFIEAVMGRNKSDIGSRVYWFSRFKFEKIENKKNI